jgi:hypothetical protein
MPMTHESRVGGMSSIIPRPANVPGASGNISLNNFFSLNFEIVPILELEEDSCEDNKNTKIVKTCKRSNDSNPDEVVVNYKMIPFLRLIMACQPTLGHPDSTYVKSRTFEQLHDPHFDDLDIKFDDKIFNDVLSCCTKRDSGAHSYCIFHPNVYSSDIIQHMLPTFRTYFNLDVISNLSESKRWYQTVNDMLAHITFGNMDMEYIQLRITWVKKGSSYMASAQSRRYITRLFHQIRYAWYNSRTRWDLMDGVVALSKVEFSPYNIARILAVYTHREQYINSCDHYSESVFLKDAYSKLCNACVICSGMRDGPECFMIDTSSVVTDSGEIRCPIKARRWPVDDAWVIITRLDRGHFDINGVAPMITDSMPVWNLWILDVDGYTWDCHDTSDHKYFPWKVVARKISRVIYDIFPEMKGNTFSITYNIEKRTWEHAHVQVAFDCDPKFEMLYPLRIGNSLVPMSLKMGYIDARVYITVQTLLGLIYKAHACPQRRGDFFGDRPLMLPLPFDVYIKHYAVMRQGYTRDLYYNALCWMVFMCWNLLLPIKVHESMCDDFIRSRRDPDYYDGYSWPINKNGMPSHEWLFSWWCRNYSMLFDHPVYLFAQKWLLRMVGDEEKFPLSPWVIGWHYRSFAKVPEGYVLTTFSHNGQRVRCVNDTEF